VTGWDALQRFLRTNPIDAGCAETFELLGAYVDAELTAGDAESRYPTIAAHLRDCAPCMEDFRGLLLAAGGSGR
jgi:hypothetical protein